MYLKFSRFVHFVSSMPTFMTDNSVLVYFSVLFFSLTIRSFFVTFPAYVWT